MNTFVKGWGILQHLMLTVNVFISDLKTVGL